MHKVFAIAFSILLLGSAPGVVNAATFAGPVTTVTEPAPGFSLNPNPVTGTWFYINLEFSETDFPNAKYAISNVLGEVVFSAPIKKTEFAGAKVRVDIADLKLNKGLYFVQVTGGDKSKILRLVVR